MKTLILIAAAVLLQAAAPQKMEIVEGNPASPVKVQIFEDLQCSDCAVLRKILDEKILPRYGTRVAFIHRDFPLPKHGWARQAAVAGRWVYEKNAEAGILFRQQILAEQNNITVESLPKWLIEFASRNKLDEQGILDSLKDPRLTGAVERDYQSAIARGISKTPTVYANGTPLVEIILYEDLARAIDQALTK